MLKTGAAAAGVGSATSGADAPPSDSPELNSDEFFARAKARLSFDVPGGLTDARIVPTTGDAGNDRMIQIVAQERPIRPAAVLIAIVDHAQPTVLLTQRAAHLNDHAGQISFPGGKIDPTDASPRDAALREAEEEVGLDRGFVEPIGYLDLYATGFGFRILPTVARVKPGFNLVINENEVESAFEVPLSFLMNPGNHQIHSKDFRGIERSYYAMPFAERYIWGATAGILRVLYERIVQA
jgi:8-oxo-dGTP pyrophosphatase MutT (NUDIX family)